MDRHNACTGTFIRRYEEMLKWKAEEEVRAPASEQLSNARHCAVLPCHVLQCTASSAKEQLDLSPISPSPAIKKHMAYVCGECVNAG